MSNPPPQDQGDDDSVEDDLRILNEMNIDRDFNMFEKRDSTGAWSDFRDAFSPAEKESLHRLSLRSSASLSHMGVSAPTLDSISEAAPRDNYDNDEPESNQRNSEAAASDSSLNVGFSPLSTDERRDIRTWAVRVERKQVFSRYYFPEQWELREKEAIQKELGITKVEANGNDVMQATIKSIFFPGDHDPKSVLLKRGPILFDGVEERELMLFTHEFLLAKIEFDTLVNLLFDTNSAQFVSHEKSIEDMQKRFNDVDSDGSGELDRCELREVFQEMGILIGERMLNELMARFDTDNSGTIDFEEFKQVFNGMVPKDQDEPQGRTFFQSMKKMLITSSQTDVKRNLDFAFPLTDIEHVESLQICCSKKTEMFAKSSWAAVSFAIFIRFRKHPLVMVCSKPQHQEAWVDAIKVALINSRLLGGDKFQRKGDDKPGWQYKLVRDSLFSLVVVNDYDGLSRFIENPPHDLTVNDEDEYYGCTALHFAAIWGRFQCAALLIVNGAEVNVKDNDKKTPLDHATDKNIIRLLKGFGGEGSSDLTGALYNQAHEEEKMKLSKKTQRANKTSTAANAAVGAMSGTMNAMRERGEKLETLDNTTSALANEAANFAGMAKQLKEKTKKQSKFGFWN